MFNAKIRKTGNSFVITIPSNLMIDFSVGEIVEADIKKKVINNEDKTR